jgi:hypothetical protein
VESSFTSGEIPQLFPPLASGADATLLAPILVPGNESQRFACMLRRVACGLR